MFIHTTQVWELSNDEQPDKLDVVTYQDAMCDEQSVGDKSPVPARLKQLKEIPIIPKVDKQEVVGDVRFSPTYDRMAKLLKKLHVAGSPQVHVLQSLLSVVLLAARRCC